MKYRLERQGIVHELDVQLTPKGGYVLRGPDGKPELIDLETRADGSLRAMTPWGSFELSSARRGDELWADLRGPENVGTGPRRLVARVERARPSRAGTSNETSAGAVLAPMAGKLLRLEVAVGARVKAGQAIAVIEAMKME